VLQLQLQNTRSRELYLHDEMADSERSPLLASGRAEGNGHSISTKVKDTGRWIARHAVAIFASILILAVVVVLAIFLGGKQLSISWCSTGNSIY